MSFQLIPKGSRVSLKANKIRPLAATKEEGRGTSSVVSFVVAMNRVDVVDLVVNLVDVDLDVDLVDVNLEVDLVLALPAVYSVFGSRLQ